jgi:hypothetical protein
MTLVNDERGLGAMPKLYGAPAYARPPALPLNPVDRPFDPDDLPLEAERTNEDEQGQQPPAPRSVEPGGTATATATASPAAHGPASKAHERPFRIRLPGRTQQGR